MQGALNIVRQLKFRLFAEKLQIIGISYFLARVEKK